MTERFESRGRDDDIARGLRRVADRGLATAALPNAAYVDPIFAEREAAAIFRRGWFAAGFAADVPEPGALMPVDIAGMPLLLVRDRLGEVRVFHNFCRHRGLKLVAEPGRAGQRIRCPYHSWSYRLDGALDRTPHVGGVGQHSHGAVDRASLGLVSVRSVVRFGVVFVDLSGEALDFDRLTAPLRRRWHDFGEAEFHGGGEDSAFELTVGCNWKLAVENYLESYHLPSVHPGLNSYSRIEDHEPILGDPGYTGQTSLVYAAQLSSAGERFPAVDGLGEAWRTRAEYIALYPNLLFGLHADHWFAIVLQPGGPERTLERVRIGYFSAEAATGPTFQAMREANVRLWRTVFAEDIQPVERMQAGRHSPAFDGGVLTPVLERTTRDFHAWTAERLLQG